MAERNRKMRYGWEVASHGRAVGQGVRSHARMRSATTRWGGEVALPQRRRLGERSPLQRWVDTQSGGGPAWKRSWRRGGLAKGGGRGRGGRRVALVARVGGGAEPLEPCQEHNFSIWSNVKMRGLHVMLKVLIKTISVLPVLY